MKDINDFIVYLNDNFVNKGGEFINNDHKAIWEKSYLPSQEKKAKEFNLDENTKKLAFNTLIDRGRLIKEIYEFFNCKDFCEIGTAEGYQHFIMADVISKIPNSKSISYSCDIRDVREKSLSKKYDAQTEFVLGTSKELAELITEKSTKLDLIWVDGDHRSGAVLKDLIRLARVQSKNCIWVFDDFNDRFGSYNELQFIASLGKSITLNMGITASGKPNTVLIVQGVI